MTTKNALVGAVKELSEAQAASLIEALVEWQDKVEAARTAPETIRALRECAARAQVVSQVVGDVAAVTVGT